MASFNRNRAVVDGLRKLLNEIKDLELYKCTQKLATITLYRTGEKKAHVDTLVALKMVKGKTEPLETAYHSRLQKDMHLLAINAEHWRTSLQMNITYLTANIQAWDAVLYDRYCSCTPPEPFRSVEFLAYSIVY